MTFRASNVLPAREYDRAKSLALQVKNLAANRRNAFAGGATATEMLSVAGNLKSFRDQLNAIKSVSGIADYARSQESDQGYDVATEFNGVISAIDSVIAELVTSIPKDASGYLLVYKINVDGSLEPRAFTGANLSTIRSRLHTIETSVS